MAFGGNLGRGRSFTSGSTKNIMEGVPEEAGAWSGGESENLSPVGRHQNLQQGVDFLEGCALGRGSNQTCPDLKGSGGPRCCFGYKG